MIKEPIIVAIDPGTTIGVAIINFSGDLIYVNSKREMKKEDVINIIISNGNPLLFATDKAKIPKFVSNIAASFSGHVFQIQEDLKYLEKKKVLESFFDKSALSTLKLNSHEFDSLASAYYVFNKLEDKLNKISLFFSKNNVEKENFLEFLTFAIKNPGINFSNILEKISKKSFEDKKQNHSYAKPIRKSNNYTKYQNTITLLTKKNYYLEKKISNLKKKQNSKTPDDSKSSLEVMSMIYKKNQSDSTINMLLLFLFRIYFFENNLLEKINKKNPKNILCVNLDGFERIEFCLKELKENFSKIEKYNLTFSLNNLFNYKSQIPIFISNLSEKNYKEVKEKITRINNAYQNILVLSFIFYNSEKKIIQKLIKELSFIYKDKVFESSVSRNEILFIDKILTYVPNKLKQHKNYDEILSDIINDYQRK